MALNKLKLVVIILVLATAGCIKKDDFTLPVKVSFKIGISPDESFYLDYIDFTGCRIGIQKIGFKGNRELGGNVHFETDPAMNLQTLSCNEQPATISTFDIPQGVYYFMQWDITVKCIDTGGLIDDRDESYPCIGILLIGNYMSLSGSVIPFIFAIDKPEMFRVQSYDPTGEPVIVLSVDKEYEAVVYFAPEKAFTAINRQSLEEAEISGDISNPKIIISSSMNVELYQIMLSGIFLSSSVVMK